MHPSWFPLLLGLPKPTPTLLLLRGLPGSGKTTLANSLMSLTADRPFVAVIAADDFFTDSDTGEYRFDPARLGEAHQDCQDRAWMAMSVEIPLVIVHNTFSRNWEMAAYRELAEEHGYRLTVATVEGDHGSLHAPPEVRERMAERWEQWDSEKAVRQDAPGKAS